MAKKRNLLIINARIINPSGILSGASLATDGAAIGHIGKIPARARGRFEMIDAKGGWAIPGFIDAHVHGGAGFDVLDGKEAIEAIAKFLAAHGVTSFLPTILAAPKKRIIEALRNIQAAKDKGGAAASQILGAHLEGPFLNPEEKGAQPPECIRKPSIAELREYLKFGSLIKIMTLAPELPGALAMIRLLKKRGIVVSAGHSICMFDDFERAAAAGLSSVTHIYSGMSGFRRINAYRVPGLVESALIDDRVSCEVIADCRHLPPPLLRLVIRCKGADNVRAVSDATRAAGLPDGTRFTLGKDTRAIVDDGVAFLENRKSFAGSVTPLDAMFRNLVRVAGCSINDAVKITSLNAARLLGLKRKGRLEKGCDADIAVLSPGLKVTHTIIAGRTT